MALRLIPASVHDLDCRPSRQPSRSRLTVLCCRSRNNLPQPLVWPGNWVHTQARTLAMPRPMPGADSLMVPIHSSVSSALTIPQLGAFVLLQDGTAAAHKVHLDPMETAILSRQPVTFWVSMRSAYHDARTGHGTATMHVERCLTLHMIRPSVW